MSRPDHAEALDQRVRDAHAKSLDHLSPRVQAQLAQRRRAALQGTAPRASRRLLPWATVASAGLALLLVMQLRPPAAPSVDNAPGVVATVAQTAAQPAAATPPPHLAAVDTRTASITDADAIAPDLSQDPEFYLWLGDTRPADAE